jgi:hypothetical protein
MPLGQQQGFGMGGGGVDWGMAMQMQTFKHDMTMSALTPGYREPNGWGGYDYHYTGGLNW